MGDPMFIDKNIYYKLYYFKLIWLYCCKIKTMAFCRECGNDIGS